jgi:hypothetical protein
MFATRSVGMSLARRFQRRDQVEGVSHRVATIGWALVHASLRDAAYLDDFFPALKRRAKFVPTLRVEET